MGLIKFQIYFNSPKPVYFCGETIQGKVEIELSSLKKINGISLAVKGEAKTSWSETTTTRNNEGKDVETTVYYNGYENYFNKKYWLAGGNSNKIEVPAGVHVYPFSVTLPDNIPSSFEGTNGYVRYTIKTTLDRPWSFDQTSKAAFTVLAPLDLNLIPRLREPAVLTLEKQLSWCTCSSGGITAVVKAPCTGFVCGQIIPLTIEIDNVSSADIATTTIKFSKNVTFYTSDRRHYRSYTVTLRKWDINKSVASKQSDMYSLNVDVPVVPPSNMINCRIIDITYSFKFNFIISGLHRNLKGYLPITIGTVPLRHMMPMRAPSIARPTAPEENVIGPVSDLPSYDSVSHLSRAVGWMPAPPGSPDAYDIPPPTYEESQFGTQNILDKSDSQYTMLNSKHYAPMYPVYSFNMPPSAPVSSISTHM